MTWLRELYSFMIHLLFTVVSSLVGPAGPLHRNQCQIQPYRHLQLFCYLHSAALKDLRFVVKALKTLSTRWEDIGMTVDVKDLDGIKKNYQGSY